MTECSLLLFLMLASISDADWVAWDYDLQSCPPGWEFYPQWEFSPEGARMEESVSSPWSWQYGHVYSESILVPSDCDSIVLDVASSLTLEYSAYGSSSAQLDYRVNGGDWIELYYRWGNYQSSAPLHEVVPACEGDVLEFHFLGYAAGGSEIYPGWGYIDWLLHDLTLTFYGDVVGLSPRSWAAIKKLGS